ncbi:hypothetical protein CCACVL1_11541, partial [Corchorus capsularis]
QVEKKTMSSNGDYYSALYLAMEEESYVSIV